MGDLRVFVGDGARERLCQAFERARRSIDVECYDVSDPQVLRALANAARSGDVAVRVHVEGHRKRFDRDEATKPSREQPVAAIFKELRDRLGPRVQIVVDDGSELLHAKAAVIDDKLALFCTANMTCSGFGSPGEVLIEDRAPADVHAIGASLQGQSAESDRVCAGSRTGLRGRIDAMLDAPGDLRIASEDLSDPEIVGRLIARRLAGKADRILIGRDYNNSRFAAAAVAWLAANRVDVRAPSGEPYMHEKYVDAGDRIYVGSGNLTRDGLDEADEVGIVASARDFGIGRAELRHDFDRAWASAAHLRGELGKQAHRVARAR